MLSKELQKFSNVRNKLLRDNPNGGYVVIKDDIVLGVFDERNEALSKGLEKYGNVPFLVKQIAEVTATLTQISRVS